MLVQFWFIPQFSLKKFLEHHLNRLSELKKVYNSDLIDDVIDGYTENKELAKQMIKEGKLIFVPDMFPKILNLVN